MCWTRPLLLALVALPLGCGPTAPTPSPSEPPAPPGPPWFRDATADLGVSFVHAVSRPGVHYMPSSMGAGVAILDADGDGRPDLLFAQNGGRPPALFVQTPAGTFRDASAGSGLEVVGEWAGLATGDADSDGRIDVLMTGFGRMALFRNEGGGRFRECSEAAGLANPLWSTSAAFADYDGDGRLDLCVADYVDYDVSWQCSGRAGGADFCAPSSFAGTAARLYRNATEPGGPIRFADATIPSGVGRLAAPGLGVVCEDFSGDGRPDFFIANDGKPNHLWVQQGDGTFREEAVPRGAAVNLAGTAEANMGVAVGDADGDGLTDLFVTHLAAETHALWKQGPPGVFRDRTAAAGLTRSRWRGTGFGTNFGDFDADGWPDLALANGRVSRSLSPPESDLDPFWKPYAERNQLFRNDGTSKFVDRSEDEPSLSGRPNVARGLAAGDLDGDGALDLVVTRVGQSPLVLLNVAPNRGHWLRVRATDPALKRDALGAVVRVTAGGRTQARSLVAAGSYLSASEPVAHFGLGSTASFERVEVTWPGGAREAFPGGPADRVLELRRGGGAKP